MASEPKEEGSKLTHSKALSSRMAMEADKEEKQPNECCQKWREKLQKVETGRRNLREAIKVLENAFQKKEEEIAKLKKECENQQKQAMDESRSAQEEKRQRLELEEEHKSLKVEFASIVQRLDDQKANVNEEKTPKELLEKERQALDLEKKKTEDLKTQINAEKKKAEEEKKLAEIAMKKIEEEKKNVGTERRKFEGEKKRADAERKRAENEKLIRETLEKKLQQLELEKQTAEEGKRYNEAKENAPVQLKNVDKLSKGEKVLKELLKKEREQLKAERRRSDEQNKQIESLHKNLSVFKEQLEKEQQCLKCQMKRADEETLQRQKLEREYVVLKEKLESALVGDIDGKKSKREKLLKELLKKEQQVLKAQRKRASEQQNQIEFLRKEHFLLKEQLEKVELKRVEEEKRQREALEKQCSVLKEELALAIQCLKSQEDQLNDTRRDLHQLRIEVNAVDGSLICEKTLPHSKMLAKYRGAKVDRNASLLIGQRPFADARLSVFGGKFNEPIPCVSGVLETSRGCSSETQVQSSALPSSVTYSSDKQLVQSRGMGAKIASNSSKMRKHKKKRGLVAQREFPATSEGVSTQVLAFPEGPGKDEDVKDCNEKRSLFGKQGNTLNSVQNFTSKPTIHNNDSVKEQNCSNRKRKVDPEILTNSLLDLFRKEKKVHLMIEEKLESLKDALRNEQYTSANSLSTKQREIKSTRKWKQENSISASYGEVMQSIDHKIDEFKADHSMKEDLSHNCSQIHMPDDENELEEDGIHDKAQTHVKNMQKFIGSRTTYDRVGKNLVDGASNFVETASQNQVNDTSVKCKIYFNIERMLQLDESEEEIYIQATHHPLSPTLPEIPSPFFEELDNDRIITFLEESPIKSVELLTTRDACINVLDDKDSVPTQGHGTQKGLAWQKGFEEESCIEVNEALLSVNQPEISFCMMEQVDSHCTDLSSEKDLSQFSSSFSNRDCENGFLKDNKVLAYQNIPTNSSILDNKKSPDAISWDDKLDNVDENKQHNLCTRLNHEDHYAECDVTDAIKIIGFSNEQIKDLRVDEENVNETFTESVLEKADAATQKFRDCRFEQGKDGDENVIICTDSHVISSPIRSSHFFPTSGIGCESSQPGHKKHADLEEHSEDSSTQGNVQYAYNVFQGNKREGQDLRCFPLYFNPSFCYDDGNVSSRLFKSIDSYLGVLIDVFSGVPDLERLILIFDSATMLSREETVCICISALVSNLASLQVNSEARSFCNSESAFFLWYKNLTDQIYKVSSIQATRFLFSKVFDLEILVSLMTEFLIEGKAMDYTVNGKQGSFHFSESPVEAEHRKLLMLQRVATIAEVEAGSNVLAGFCLALGSVECLYKVMYKVLRWCKKDHIWIHTVVYSITFLCWKHSLQVCGSNLLGNTISTIVLLLEGHEKGYPHKFLDHFVSFSVQKKTYPLSIHCPFAEDVLSMDAIISSLLETLYQFPLSGYTGEKTPIKVLDCENSAFIGCVERKVESQRMNYCQQDGAASNSSQDVSKHGCQSQIQIFKCANHLSILVDCVLALELVAQYLGWEWIYNELIPQFWRMAQPNAPEELIMTIFMLVGSVGRFGIDYDGCEQRGVEELRCNFSTLLDLHCMNTGRKIFSFSCQLVAVQSLFALISGNIKMCTANQVEPDEGIIGRKTIHSTHIKILKKWYSNLREEERSMLPEHIRVDLSLL